MTGKIFGSIGQPFESKIETKRFSRLGQETFHEEIENHVFQCTRESAQ